MKIGLISDTHSFLDQTVFEHFKDCDEIWHLGDIGNPDVLVQLEAFKPTLAVYGNIDEQDLRFKLPEDLLIEREGLKVLMTHIGALPSKLSSRIKKLLQNHKPDLFLCGHSHILRVIKADNYIYINPGAAGHHGFHHTRTIMRMEILERKITNLEVIELGKR